MLEQSELTLNIEKSSPTAAAYNRLYELVGILRSENGCPWDKVQTPLSMRRDLIEETFEAVDAITENDSEHAKEELGDVLLNATMISYMFEQKGDFKLCDSLNELCDKLVRRHPHVFSFSEGKSESKGKVKNSEEVLNQWDRIKENVEGRKENSILDEVPEGFPPLLRSYKMQKKAAKKGFDWNNADECMIKVKEEFCEVEEAAIEFEKQKKLLKESGIEKPEAFTINASNPALDEAQSHLEEEIGDLMFAVINYGRKLGVDPEVAMSKVNSKFYNRFTYVESKMKEQNIEMIQSNLSKMDEFWNEAKKLGK